jgi:chorismate dehydratase
LKKTSTPSSEIRNGWRIGGLHYRNALPLQRGVGYLWGSTSPGHSMHPEEGLAKEGILHGTPAETAAAFAAGNLDLALLPVGAIWQGRWEKGVVPGTAIAADGPAYSVYVTWPKGQDPSGLKVYRDPASRSSNLLYEVLRREDPGFGQRFASLSEGVPHAGEISARVLIGDLAVAFRREAEKTENTHEFLDLAGCWREHSGLPFVFARWVIRTADPQSLADPLAALCAHNLATLDDWTASWDDADFWRSYLRRLSYSAGAGEEEAMRFFSHLARRHGLLPAV